MTTAQVSAYSADMKMLVGGLTAGLGFGVVAGLVAVGSARQAVPDTPVAVFLWTAFGEIPALAMSTGWAFAGLVVCLAWLSASPVEGAVTGALVLPAAHAAFSLTATAAGGEGGLGAEWLLVAWLVGGLLGAATAWVRRVVVPATG
ncbi:hypothetical protein ACFWIN_11965 [Streptomyces sp. NPDC127049]|uniref:hypothetical protein n=1 Tax=Streptomyces sp. NPDC127049 TaxID=3347118 RepID=UPI00365E4FFB